MDDNKTRLDSLFTPLSVASGKLHLENRVVMLPMTRVRAENDGTPSRLMVEHYAQRASAGLIITDSTAVSISGRSFLNGPGMYTTEHALSWKEVTEAVHKKGGKIFLQINHVGRLNNLQYLPRAIPPVAPSAIPFPTSSRQITINIPRVTPYAVPRALETDEIPLIVDEFVRATKLAVFAGFDGVEIHADSGYLIHQFFSTNVNQRTDKYGGSIQNRVRIGLEVLDAVIAVNGAEYVAIKFTPGFQVGDIEETDQEEKYLYLIDELNQREQLAFMHLYFGDLATSDLYAKIRERFNGAILAEGSLSPEQYAQMITNNTADLIGFGRDFIANPDLLYRIKNGLSLSSYNPSTLYTWGSEGYTDYPVLKTVEKK